MNWKLTIDTPCVQVYNIATEEFSAQIEHNPKSLYTKLTVGYNVRAFTNSTTPPLLYSNTAVTCDPVGFATEDIRWFFHHLTTNISRTKKNLFDDNINLYETELPK